MTLPTHIRVWLASASLTDAGESGFSGQRLKQQISLMFGQVNATVQTFISAHANASSPKNNPTVYNYLYRLDNGLYRLTYTADQVHPTRTGHAIWPPQASLPEVFWPLWRVTTERQQNRAGVLSEVAVTTHMTNIPQSGGKDSSPDDDIEVHSRLSSYREALLEHLFIGELMRALWPIPLEVLKPQVDFVGYDVILQCDGVMRHVQLKSSFEGASTSKVNMHVGFPVRPGACIIWIRFDQRTLFPSSYLWLGGRPEESFPTLDGLKVAKHTKANAEGQKAERPNIREVPRHRFTSLASLNDLIELLFGRIQSEEPVRGSGDPVERLVTYIRGLEDFRFAQSDAGHYNHMGATLTEAILQAGIDYRHVVRPRVDMLLRSYPEARSSTQFLELLGRYGSNNLLDFSGEKPERVLALTRFFADESIETEAQLRQWLLIEGNPERLMTLGGVGPKTVDYLQILVGIDNSAVDRHLAEFVALAGVDASGYASRKAIIEEAAKRLDVEKRVLDYSIWLYMSDRSRLKRR